MLELMLLILVKQKNAMEINQDLVFKKEDFFQLFEQKVQIVSITSSYGKEYFKGCRVNWSNLFAVFQR